MDIAVLIIQIVADLVLLQSVLAAAGMMEELNGRHGTVSVLVSAAAVTGVGALAYVTIASQTFVVRLLLTIANLFKYLIVTWVLYRRCSIKLICTVFTVQFVCNMLTSAVALFIPSGNTEQYTLIGTVILLFVRGIVLILLIAIKRKSGNIFPQNVLELVPRYIFLLILACCFFASGLIQSADIDTEALPEKLSLIKFFSFAVMLCISAVGISLLTNVLAKRYYSNISHILEEQVQTQLDHYEQREKANTEIRRFRHDYANHINCIKALLDSERYHEVAEYLNKLSDMLPSGSFSYSTGNYLSDAILSDKRERAAKDDIRIDFSGSIPTSINNTDLCIILSNALDNSIEACRAYDGERVITVFGGYRHGYFILTVKNPTVNKPADSELPVTTKADKQHHGFGLVNISSVVRKYDGVIKHEIRDGQFILSLTFNNVLADAGDHIIAT